MSAFWIAVLITIAVPIAIILGAMTIIATMKAVRGDVIVATKQDSSWPSRHPIATTIMVAAAALAFTVLMLVYGQRMWAGATSMWWLPPVLIFAAVAIYAWIKHGGGRASLAFLYAGGIALFVSVVAVVILGPDGALKAGQTTRDFGNSLFEERSAPPVTTPKIAGPMMIPAKQQGQVIAPAGQWSDWLTFSTKKCAYMWGEDPNGNRFTSKYMDRNDDVWAGLNSGDQFVKARSFRSNTHRPERVNYQLVDRRPDGSCEKL